jgi:hypothetical protein
VTNDRCWRCVSSFVFDCLTLTARNASYCHKSSCIPNESHGTQYSRITEFLEFTSYIAPEHGLSPPCRSKVLLGILARSRSSLQNCPKFWVGNEFKRLDGVL